MVWISFWSVWFLSKERWQKVLCLIIYVWMTNSQAFLVTGILIRYFLERSFGIFSAEFYTLTQNQKTLSFRQFVCNENKINIRLSNKYV